jgi:uncharacterized protein YcbK (DUF882 family)
VPFSAARLRGKLRAGRCIGIAAALCVAGVANSAFADNGARTISLHHIHTKEDITVTFKRGGRYDDAALTKLNWFLRDWRRDEQTKIDPQLFDMLWEVSQEVGGKEPIHIVSAYRSPATNAMLRRRGRGVAQFSQHMLGKAIDFFIPDASLDKVRAAGLRVQNGGVGYYPSSGAPFVHMDTGSIRHWPRMTRDQLSRVFPNGRTVHVPSDGTPLANYELALADVQKRGNKPSHTSVAAANAAGISTEAKEKPGFFAKLLGAKDEDEEEIAAPRGRAAVASAKATEETVQVASAVPMPRARPLARSQVAEATPAPDISSAKPQSVAYAQGGPTPNAAQIVQSRGIWGGAIVREEIAPAAAPQEPRLAWNVGPAGRTRAEHAADRKSAERARPMLMASAGGDITSGLPWSGASNEARMPSETVLAYAAAGPAETIVRPTIAGGVSRLSSSARPAPRRAAASLSPQDPWLRGLVLAPSIKTTMAVAVLGAPDYRALAQFMHKPRALIPSKFAAETENERTFDRFQGKALDFPSTIRFGGMLTARVQ